VPLNEEAVFPPVLEVFLHNARPKQLHFLGAAAAKTLMPKIQIIAEAALMPIHPSVDANICRCAINGRITNEKRSTAIQEALYERSEEAQKQFSGLPDLWKAKPGDALGCALATVWIKQTQTVAGSSKMLPAWKRHSSGAFCCSSGSSSTLNTGEHIAKIG
jgi:hypothetical protein